MKRAKLLQEIRKMEFERIYTGWRAKRFTQGQAARILGVCERTFRCYINQYDDEGMERLYDKQLHAMLEKETRLSYDIYHPISSQ